MTAPALIDAICARHACRQADLARALGVSPVVVTRWRTGRRKPGQLTLVLLRLLAGETTVEGVMGATTHPTAC